LASTDGSVIGGAVDVTGDERIRGWIKETATALGGVDILIPNASALVGSADIDAWRFGLEVDVLETVRAVEVAMPFLEALDAASIVAISITAAVNTSDGVRAYSGLKAALISYISGLSTILGSTGIRANTVSPGASYFEGGTCASERRLMLLRELLLEIRWVVWVHWKRCCRRRFPF
jgi:3-oxoacyl-[acyl-carrier protein] reductase